MDKKNLYNEKSIESLSPLEFTRLRPGVYAGDTTYSTQLLVEILSNSIDEYRLGHGSVINIRINRDIVQVEDYGQGFIPNSFREDGKTILEAAFSVLNTSGKYREDGTYEGTSLGSFGIGSKITTYLSHWLNVETWRDGQTEKIRFEEGEFKLRDTSRVANEKYHATRVEWQPSEEFFTHTEVEVPKVKSLIKTLVCLCPGLIINLDVNGSFEKYVSDNGINDLVDEAVKGKELIKNRFILHSQEGKNEIDLVLTYTSNYSSTIVPYVNTGLTESGQHITQIKTTITREFNKFFKEKGWLKEKDENLSGDDIQEGMYIVFNLTAPNVAYDAQVKSRITKIDMKPFIDAFSAELRNYLAYNEKEIKVIAEKAINARKAREAAKKAKDAVRGIKPSKEKGLKAKMQLSDKFLDCVNKNPTDRNLILVEGTSAASAVLEARNAKTDAIYMLRGKIISPLRTTLDKLLKNQEMSDIIKILNAGFMDTFDIRKMEFDKIIIATDQDSDGADIELLLMTFFYTYMRPIVLEGRLYRAVTPLYIIRQKGHEFYCYSEQELTEWKESHSGNYDLLRAKGLGELNAEDLHKVCFQDQRYKRITVADVQAAENLLNVLQGPSADLRKKYIYENAHELGFNF